MVNLYEEDELDETGHKKENPLMKLLLADTGLEVEKNMKYRVNYVMKRMRQTCTGY